MALKILTKTPPNIALNTSLDNVLLFSGQRTAIPDTQIPKLEIFANPQSEIAQTIPVLASSVLMIAPRSWNATNSFKISLFPHQVPSIKISCPSNPIKKPKGAKI